MADPVPQVFIGPQDPTQSGWGGTFPPSPAGDQYVPYTGADVAALLGQPPGTYTNPVTGDVVYPSPNPQTPVPGAPIPNPPQPSPQGPIYTDASGFGSFFGAASIFGSRRYRPSRFSRELEHLARRVGLAAVRGAADAFTYFRGVAPPLSAATDLVPYVARASRYFSPAAMAIGEIVGLAFPESAGEVTTPEQLARLPLARGATPPGMLRATEKIDRDLRYIGRPVDLNPIGQEMLGFPIAPIALPASIAKRKGGGIEAALEDMLPPGLRGAVEAMRRGQPAGGGRLTTPQPENAGPPTPAGYGSTAYGAIPQAATSSPTSRSSSTTRSAGGIFSRVPNLPLTLGLGGVAALAIFRSFSNSGSGQPAFTAPAITPGSQTVTPTQPQTGVSALLVGGYQGNSASGDCGCGPRGPRRKCLERAPVTWRSGRNKGKAAGSKCVRYAQRAS